MILPVAYPQWIEKMYPTKTGRDHLGLGGVTSFQILTLLSPSIYVLTFQPRYYSFYAFLLDEFWKRYKNPNEATAEAWTAFFRPRDFLFSVGANFHKIHHDDCKLTNNIVGSQKTSGLVDQPVFDYAEHRDYIKSQWGGYGLYYRGVMEELGLILFGGRGYPIPVDMPTREGKELAATYREAIQDTMYYRKYFYDDNARVPSEVLSEFMNQACLCQLKKDTALDRLLLLDAFLHRGDADNRRNTFRLLLDIADQTQGYAIDEDIFRQLIYFQSAHNGAKCVPSETIIQHYRYWRLAQLREYFAFALNALWKYLCDWGILEHGDIRPLSLQSLWDHLHLVLDFDALATHLKLNAPRLDSQSDFSSLLDWLQNVTGAAWQDYQGAFYRNVLDEHSLYRIAYENHALSVPAMVCLLGIIYLRFNEPSIHLQPEWEISKMYDHSGWGISVDGFIQTLKQRLQGNHPTVHTVLEWIYREYIVLQHQIVADTKLPDNTFRFQWEGNRLRFYAHYNQIAFMSARFDALTTTLFELGFCGHFSQPDHGLKLDGQHLLEQGDM